MKIAKLLNPFYVYRRGFVELEYLMLRHGLRASLNYQKLAALKDKHQGKRAFIIGNGSSLRISDLDRLTGEITFACNKIYLAFDQTQWRPTYYVAGDRLFFMQTWFYLNNLSNCGITMLFPYWFKYLFPPIKEAIYFKAISEPVHFKEPRFSINALIGLYWGATVTYLLFQLAYYMGIRKMYLLGVDYDYNTKKEHLTGKEPYVVTESISSSYFHPRYHQQGEKVYPPNLNWHEKAYCAAHKAMSPLKGEIYNATRGGKLEIFPRVEFDTLF